MRASNGYGPVVIAGLTAAVLANIVGGFIGDVGIYRDIDKLKSQVQELKEKPVGSKPTTVFDAEYRMRQIDAMAPEITDKAAEAYDAKPMVRLTETELAKALESGEAVLITRWTLRRWIREQASSKRVADESAVTGEPKRKLSMHPAWHYGDAVEIIDGEYKGKTGVIDSQNQGSGRIIVDYGGAAHPGRLAEVNENEIRLRQGAQETDGH